MCASVKMKLSGEGWALFGSGDSIVYVPIERKNAATLSAQVGECRIAALYDLDWNADLSPWRAKAVFRGQEDFAGNADAYLKKLVDCVIAEAEAGQTIRRRMIAGYSMAGLFAMYAAARCDCFSGAASASGSMWFGGFIDFLKGAPRVPERAYFSVGDRERLGRNRTFQSIEECTRAAERILREKGAETTFELNPGGHFSDPVGRLAKGIRWILQQ